MSRSGSSGAVRPATTDPSGTSNDPTVPARAALTQATEAAILGLGSAPRPPEPSHDDVPVRSDELSPDIAVGKTLSGRLEIVAELGGGPLGKVFKAVDRKKGSVVAVKAIPAARLPDEALSGRFAETVSLVKSLVHPNLVKIYGAGREGETAFTIMQYLEGLPLRSLLEVKRENKGTFGFDEAEPIIAQICQGLSFAHGSLVHGDLKPENVILQVDSLKLIDVGLSRLFSPSDWRSLQKKGRSGGAYLAPEYGAPNPKIDRRADVYSVGAILYEMLTGRAPAGPDSPPVSSFNPSVPRAVDRVVAKAMSAKPEDRYDSASELKEAVFRVLGGDILADDLESPVGELGTFAEAPMPEPKDDGGIEIEYVMTEHPPGVPVAQVPDDRRSDDRTPVGAIELHEPLWEPDEIERAHRQSDPKIPAPTLTPSGVSIDERAERARSDRRGSPEGDRAIDALAADSAPLAPAPIVPPPRAEHDSHEALGSGDHHSVDLAEDGITVAGLEPDPAPSSGYPPDRRTPAWLEKIEGPRSSGEPPVIRPVQARVRTNPGTDVNEISFEGSSGGPLEIDERAERARSDRRGSPQGDRAIDRPSAGDSAATGPSAIAPGDPIRSLVPESDRPTDPREQRSRLGESNKPTSVLDRPTLRKDDNPAARALSSPNPPPLELSFSQGTQPDGPLEPVPVRPPSGGFASSQSDKPTDVPARPRPSGIGPPPPPPPVRRVPEPATSEPLPVTKVALDLPTSPPRPNMIANRGRSRGPLILAAIALVAIGGGGALVVTQRDRLAGFLPGPHAPSCPEGMVGFPSGTFKIGSLKSDPDRDFTEPLLHEETTAAFCIDTWEYPDKEGAAPLVGMTYAQADEACTKQGKRLCAEDEWERACKGPESTKFPFGDVYQKGVCNVGSNDAPGTLAAIGAFPTCGRQGGPKDMVGNVAELTATAWPDDSSSRVVKGGSAKLPPAMGRCAFRDSVPVDKGADDVGFRCCWSSAK